MRVQDGKMQIKVCDVCRKAGITTEVPSLESSIVHVENRGMRRWDLCEEHMKLLTDTIGPGTVTEFNAKSRRT